MIKKILCLISLTALTVISCLPRVFALDDEDWDSWRLYDEDTVKTLGQRDNLVIQEKPSAKEIYLYDTEQKKILFSVQSEKEINDNGSYFSSQCNRLFFTEDGRILYSTWKNGITTGIIDIQTFQLSPDGMEKTLLTEKYAIDRQDLAGRFICQTTGISIYGQFMQGVPDPYGMMPVAMDDTLSYKGVFDANFDKILIPFDYTRWETYGNYIICGYPLDYDDEDRIANLEEDIRMCEGVLNAVTLDWIVPLTKRSIAMYSEYDTESFMEKFRHGWVFSDHTYFADAQGASIKDDSFHEGDIVFDSKNNLYQMLGDSLNKEYDLTKWKETSEWAADGVAQAEALGLLPEQLTILYEYPISRRNFCHLLIQTLEKINPQMVRDAIKPSKNVQFFDVDTTSCEYGIPVCSRRICLASVLGVVTGYTDKTFRPESLITRQEAAVMLNRMLKALKIDAPQAKTVEYADGDKIDSWATEDVNAVSAAGIMNGVGEEKFDPEGTYTLEQSILTMLRIYNLSEKQEGNPFDLTYTVIDDVELNNIR